MTHATVRFWDGKAWTWDTIATSTPLPTARLGEAIATVAQASVDAYTDVAGTLIDTLMQSATSVGYDISAATAGITFKVVGSIDGTKFWDLTAYDQTGTVQAAVDVAVAAAAHGVLLCPAGLKAFSCFRYFKVQQKSTVTATPGTGTVTGFVK